MLNHWTIDSGCQIIRYSMNQNCSLMMNRNESNFGHWLTSNFLSNSDHIRLARRLCIVCGQDDRSISQRDFGYKYPIEYHRLSVWNPSNYKHGSTVLTQIPSYWKENIIAFSMDEKRYIEIGFVLTSNIGASFGVNRARIKSKLPKAAFHGM